MAIASKYANAHTTILTGYTNASNAYADDGTNYATAAPNKNNTVSAYWGFAAFSTSDIPDGSTINSVTVSLEFKVSTQQSVAEQYAQVYVNTSAVGSEQSNTSQPLTDTVLSHAVTSGVTLANLRSADVVRCRSRSLRGNDNDAVTFSIDYVKIDVDYTVVVNINGTAAVSASSSVSAQGKKAASRTAPVSAATSASVVGRKHNSRAASVSGTVSAVVDIKRACAGTASVSASAVPAVSGSKGAFTALVVEDHISLGGSGVRTTYGAYRPNGLTTSHLSGAYTDIDEDPSSPDGSWLTFAA